MAFPSSFLDELRLRVSIRDVVGSKVKLMRKGKDFWGLCPFHSEKTPSFSVNDDKGFYHCFGCGEHGDIISFVMKNDSVSFIEAVERLAGMAGMRMPDYSPEEALKKEKQLGLIGVLEKACSFFESQLRTNQDALDYLKKRAISPETVKSFRLGYAPSGNAMRDHLMKQSIPLEKMIEAGLVASREGRTYDYFRDRIMFPIMNKRGSVIAFGGRIMGHGEPKYLNSPETEIFHKSEVLYGYDKAANGAKKAGKFVVVEGYMDTIALHQAGINYAVAPLGTALTEMQVMSLWRSVEEPVLCFDGDKAGQNAAIRSISRVLPILKPGYSLKFAWMPQGLDPDELINEKGTGAFLDILNRSDPMIDIVWKTLKSASSLDTPEKKAQMEKKISDTAEQIKDSSVRKFYLQELRNRLFQTLAPSSKGRKAQDVKKNIRLPKHLGDDDIKWLIAYALLYPDMAADFSEQLLGIESSNSGLNQILHNLAGGGTLEDRDAFVSFINILKSRYGDNDPSKFEKTRDDLSKKIKSFTLIALNEDIINARAEAIKDPSKLDALKTLLAEKEELEKEIGY